ncbi:hypothetical protein Tco_1428069, partial [Tanacetum coccineum]
YKPIEAFKLDLEESPPEATDERCKIVETHGQAKLVVSLVHLGNMDGNDIDAQRRVRGKCTEKQCPYMTMAQRDVIKGVKRVMNSVKRVAIYLECGPPHLGAANREVCSHIELENGSVHGLRSSFVADVSHQAYGPSELERKVIKICWFFCESNDKTESPRVGKNITTIITRDLLSNIVGYATGAAAQSHHCVGNPP